MPSAAAAVAALSALRWVPTIAISSEKSIFFITYLCLSDLVASQDSDHTVSLLLLEMNSSGLFL